MNIQVTAVAFLLFACAMARGQQSQPIQKALAGTWRLVSATETLRDGKTRPYPDLGPDARGMLIYADDGHMCVVLMKPNRPPWRSDEEEATDAEKISAASGFTSYCGTYKIDEEKHVITHYPKMSFMPNFIGSEQKRPYKLEGKRLILSDTVPVGEIERWTIVWEKVSE
ncbi:MAG TPA: lipocalin-like domain-containing protein [Terriglobales bacterium]